ncbi:MAG: MurR/RpiR family transcriptional regulator [Acidimicrobiia bacterium]
MNTPMSSSSVSELIAAVNDRLTPTDRRIAQAVLDDPTLLAFGTVSDLAERVGTSRPSIVRFATKLGFSGYTNLQEHVRAGMSVELSRPSERIRFDESLEPVEHESMEHDALRAGLESVFEGLRDGVLERIAARIVDASDVWIVSGETSRAGAYALQSGLTMIRQNVRLVDDHSMGRDLAEAGDGDVAVLLDFHRYRRGAIVAAEAVAARGVAIVAITDGPLSPLAALADDACFVDVPGIGPFDSSVPAVAAAELVVSQVARTLHDSAADRIDRTEAMWESTDTFVA